MKNFFLTNLLKFLRLFGKDFADRWMLINFPHWMTEVILSEILREEIQNEINQQIIKAIYGIRNEQGSN